MTDRGQTTHDFAFGISVFILAAALVITFVPNVTAPYASGITEQEQEHSRTVARGLVANLSTGDSPTTLDRTRTAEFFDHDWGNTGLQRLFGVRDTVQVNATLRGLDADTGVVTACSGRCAVGPPAEGRSTATAVRLVRVGADLYRLEVRVW